MCSSSLHVGLGARGFVVVLFGSVWVVCCNAPSTRAAACGAEQQEAHKQLLEDMTSERRQHVSGCSGTAVGTGQQG